MEEAKDPSARLTLRAGSLEVQVAPQAGGSIARFDFLRDDGERVEIFRGSDEAYDDALESGCFPLVPFVNRIRGGTFLCGGRTIRLAPNMRGDASPLHGQGWRGAWRPTDAAGCIELVYEHAAGEWPWDYEARQHISLDPAGMDVRLTCRNLSAEPMPCGLGLHPYFPCTAETVLDTAVTHAWTIDAQVLPVERVSAVGPYDLRQRRICGQGLDNGFDGWEGEARIDWRERGLSLCMSSRDATRFQVYSPAQGGLFVAEPVQNANAALNLPQGKWAEAGLRLLHRGKEAVLRARFAVLPTHGVACT